MKKALKVLTGILLLFTLSFLSWKIYDRLADKKAIREKTSRLPDFLLKDSQNGQLIGSKDVKERALWLIFFHSSCDYCRMEADNIRNTPALAKLDIWLVSSEPADTLIAFGKRSGLDTLHHVKLLYDNNHETSAIFNVASTPSSFLYNPEKHLIWLYKGIVRPETVCNDAEIY